MVQEMALSSKERVIKALNFQKPDRIPIFDSFWKEFIENWHKEKKIDQKVNIYDYYQIDISIQVADETFFPSRKGEIKREKGYVISRDGWGATVRRKRDGYFYEIVDTALKNKNNLDRLNFEPANLDFRYEDFLKGVKEEEKKKRAIFCKIGGPFIRSSFIRGETDWYMDLASDKVFAKDLAEKVGSHLIQIGLESLSRANLYETGIWIYDDMGSNKAPLFSPKVFEEIFLPIYKRMVYSLKKAGAKKVILHCDGNILSFLDMVIEAGIDGINPVEPKAGMNILELKKRYDNRLSYIGGVDNAFILPKGNKKEIEDHILPILEAGREGGIVIGTHSIGPDIPVKNYDWYHQIVSDFSL